MPLGLSLPVTLRPSLRCGATPGLWEHQEQLTVGLAGDSGLEEGVLCGSRSHTQLPGATFSGLYLECKVRGAAPAPSINIEAPQPHPPVSPSGVELARRPSWGDGWESPGQERVYQGSHGCWYFPDGRGFRITGYSPTWAQGAARRWVSLSLRVHMHARTGICEHDSEVYLLTAGQG